MSETEAEQPPVPRTRRSRVPTSDRGLERDIRSRAARDRSHSHRRLLRAFLDQHQADLAMRRSYAKLLLGTLIGQALGINLLLVLLGFGKKIGFEIEPWTARAFVAGVFAEVCVLVTIVAKYLFTPSLDRILDVVDRFRSMSDADGDSDEEEEP